MAEDPRGGINLGGFGDIDMFPGETENVMKRMSVVGSNFSATFGRHLIEINRLRALVGKGSAAAQFVADYDGSAPNLIESGQNAGKAYEQMAKSGAQIVQMYLITDGRDVPAALAEFVK